MCVKIDYSNYFSQVDYIVRKNRLRIIFHRSTIMCVKIDYSNYFSQVDYNVRKNRLFKLFFTGPVFVELPLDVLYPYQLVAKEVAPPGPPAKNFRQKVGSY